MSLRGQDCLSSAQAVLLFLMISRFRRQPVRHHAGARPTYVVPNERPAYTDIERGAQRACDERNAATFNNDSFSQHAGASAHAHTERFYITGRAFYHVRTRRRDERDMRACVRAKHTYSGRWEGSATIIMAMSDSLLNLR